MTTRSHSNTRVFVALSGGVDSAVSAYLLKREGYDVTGVYMENWKKTKLTPHCTTEEDRRDALKVASHLDIPFMTVNFEKEYEEKVIEYFYREYAQGRTPNPDIMCNTEIKFKAYLATCESLGADYIATGHYARVSNQNGIYQLQTGVDPNKDQTYFLHTITQEQLSKTMFPIGGLMKSEVRELARKAELPNAEKPDSQGICFVGPVNVITLLKQRIPETPGDIIDANGKKVGEHRGLAFYTIGQREGIGVGGGSGVPYYVAAKDPARNLLIVAHGNQDETLYKSSLTASHPHWVAGEAPSFPLQCQAVIRYRQKPQEAVVNAAGDLLSVEFAEAQRAITPGQSVVFYDGDVCLGGAVIEQ